MKHDNCCTHYLIIDFDSTFVKLEALDNLADIALRDNPQKEKILSRLKHITRLGMEGKITFSESLGRRLKMFSSTKDHVDELIERLKQNVSESVRTNKDFFRKNSEKIYIISGGFVDYIFPIIKDYGIPKDHVLANKFRFDSCGNVVGIEAGNYLAQDEGKVKAVKALRLNGRKWVVGDGYTDYKIKETECANIFVAFTENVARDIVVEKADFSVDGFDKVIQLFEKESFSMSFKANLQKT